MKVNKSVKIELSREELEAIQIVYNMFYNIELDEEKTIDNCIFGGASLEDVRTTLAEIWELSGRNIDHL